MNHDHTIRSGMVGLGMIFDETYRHFFEQAHHTPITSTNHRPVKVSLPVVASRTGSRAEKYRQTAPAGVNVFRSFAGSNATNELLASGVDAVCVATPDDRHFVPARAAL